MAMSNFSTVPSFGQPAEAWLSRGGIAINGVHYGRPDDAIEWGVQGCPLLPRAIREQHSHLPLPRELSRTFSTSLTVDQLDCEIMRRFDVARISEETRIALRNFLCGLPSLQGWVAIPAGIPLLWLEELPITARTRGAVLKAFHGSGRDGYFDQALLASQLLAYESVGKSALNELACVIESAELPQANAEQSGSHQKSTTSPDSSELADQVNVAALKFIEHISPIARHFNAFARWAMAETRAQTVGDALAELLSSSIENEEWSAIASVRLSDLAAPARHPYAVLDAWVQQLDSRWRAVLWGRIAKLDSNPTLQELAESFDLSRERVRQIERRTRQQLDSFVAENEALPIRWRAKTLRQMLGIAKPENMVEHLLAAPPGYRDYRTVLLEMAGPYDREHGWLILQSARDTDPSPAILNQIDEVGRIDGDLARVQLSEWGLDASLHEDWLTRDGALCLFNGQLVRWGDSIPDRMAFAVADLGRPATIDDLMSHVGERSVRSSVANALGNDERLVRVNQTHWALMSWDLPEYTGVAYSIGSLLEEAGGSVPVDEMIQWMYETFGVPESTTRAYFYSPMFIVEGALLRLQTDADEPYRCDPDAILRTPGVFNLGPGRLGRLLKVDSNMLRGSGTMLTHAAGAILQVEVNQNITFSNQHGDTVTVTFPESSIVGPSLGSVRRIAERLSAKAGDYLTLVLDRSGLSLMAQLTDLSGRVPSWETVGRMTGIIAPVNLDSLASALGCRPGEVRGLLRARGDDALLEALPQSTSSTSLLAELAALETQIDNGRE